MTAIRVAEPSRVGAVVELGRYTLPTGLSRRLYGQRVGGIVRVVDAPLEGTRGRRYLVERGLTSKAELDALVADYLSQSEQLGRPAILVVIA